MQWPQGAPVLVQGAPVLGWGCEEDTTFVAQNLVTEAREETDSSGQVAVDIYVEDLTSI